MSIGLLNVAEQSLVAELDEAKEKQAALLDKAVNQLVLDFEEGTYANICAEFVSIKNSRAVKSAFERANAWRPNFFSRFMFEEAELRAAKFKDELEYVKSQVRWSYMVEPTPELKIVGIRIKQLDEELAKIKQQRRELASAMVKLPKSIQPQPSKPKAPSAPLKQTPTRTTTQAVTRTETRTVYDDTTDNSLVNMMIMNNLLNQSSTPQPPVFGGNGGSFDGGGATGSWDTQTIKTDDSLGAFS